MSLKRLSKILFIVFVSIFLCMPFARSVAEGGDVVVAATVSSKVSKSNSTVTQNVKEVLADGVQRAIITVTLHDAADNPLSNLKVSLTSNRGEIDTINALSGVEKTNADGMAYFEVSSIVPGEAVFTPLADSLVTLGSINVTFLPLPFPKNVTISVEVPKVINPSGKIDILTPSKESVAEKGKNLVNMGVNICHGYFGASKSNTFYHHRDLNL